MAEEYYLGELGSELMLSSVERKVAENPLHIKKETRLASGKLVRDVVAIKRIFPFSYEWLPGQDTDVADGGVGRDSIRDMYDAGGSYNLRVPLEKGGFDDVVVYFDKYKEVRVRTAPHYLWDLSFSLVEE